MVYWTLILFGIGLFLEAISVILIFWFKKPTVSVKSIILAGSDVYKNLEDTVQHKYIQLVNYTMVAGLLFILMSVMTMLL